ncbi:hypothetical protein BH23THE1_BH23THE1_35750 [soil metagenome]
MDQNFELSGLLGINYIIFDHVDIGIRYSRGITHTMRVELQDSEGYKHSISKVYNHYIQFLVRYKI